MKIANDELLEPLRRLAAEDATNRAQLPVAIDQFLAQDDNQKIPMALAIGLVGSLVGIRRSAQRRLSEALQSLAPGSPAIVAALEQALDSNDPDLRWGAAYTLGKLSPENSRIWPAIQEMLGAEDGDSRWAAAEITCAMARQSPLLQEELRLATRAAGGTLRRMALYCLRDLRVEGLFYLAQERLADSETHGRLSALTTLTTTAVPPDHRASLAGELVAMLTSDPMPGVRRAAAATIGKLHLLEARPALETASRSEDSALARAARQALDRWPATQI